MRFAAFALFTCLVLAACDTAADDGLLRRVNFEAGSAFRYERTFAELDSDGTPTFVSRDTFEVRIAGENATVGGLGGLVEWVVRRDTTEASVWYRQSSRALEEIAYEPSLALANAPVLRSGGLAASPSAAGLGWMAPPEATGDIVLREPPRVVVRYPAEVGDSWTHWEREEDGWSSTREVTGYHDVATPAGTFRCVVLRSRNFANGEDMGLEMTDYVSERGLIRRVISYEFEPEPGQTHRAREQHELIALED
ncbi:MAG TPA: hypothetical protein VD962_01595 [Rubricoccaceae bacterium]|nr:hypothetical protein [Rubricoccaceae bacterium]